MMKNRNLESKLAYLAALVVLIGVSAAATSAFAAEPTRAASALTAELETIRDAANTTISGAREAMTETAAEAVKALEAETAFRLENQLSDITSTLIAGSR